MTVFCAERPADLTTHRRVDVSTHDTAMEHPIYLVAHAMGEFIHSHPTISGRVRASKMARTETCVSVNSIHFVRIFWLREAPECYCRDAYIASKVG